MRCGPRRRNLTRPTPRRWMACSAAAGTRRPPSLARRPAEMADDALGLPPGAFDRLDPEDDEFFYEPARLVCHIDDGAIAALTEFYRTGLPAGGALIDLMSSWVSHLPPEIAYGEIIGHGMNAEELAANPRFSRWFLQNFNRDPVLPLPDDSIDAAMICVSIQYLQRPVELLREVA